MARLDEKLGELQPWFADYARAGLEAFREAGIEFTLYDFYRSPEDQEHRYAIGDTRARAFQSPHQWGLAFDIVAPHGEQSNQQLWAQSVWRSWGFGTVQGDPAHVEMPGWKDIVLRAGFTVP